METKKRMGRAKVNWIEEDSITQYIEGFIIRRLRETNGAWTEVTLVDIQHHIGDTKGKIVDLATMSRRLAWLVKEGYIAQRKKVKGTGSPFEYNRTPAMELARPDMIKQVLKRDIAGNERVKRGK